MSLDFSHTQDFLFWIVAGVIIVTFLTQLYYYVFIFRKVGLKKHNNNTQTDYLEPVSVIICVQNEANNLEKILPMIMDQNYPVYEVIIVNDSSTDDSEHILEFAKPKYPNLQIRNLIAAGKPAHGKSVVLGVGIKAARYENIILTDSNCRPSPNWLKSMSAGFAKSEIVLGYTRNTGGKLFIRIANYFESMFMLGYTLSGKPFIGSGENSGFKKEIFFEKKGFNSLVRKQDKVEHVFFNAISNKKNTSAILAPDAINTSTLALSIKEWCLDCSKGIYSQRLFRRGTRHKKLPEIISRSLFYISIPLGIALSSGTMYLWTTIVGIFLIRLIIQIIIFSSTQKILGENKLVAKTIFWDLYSIFVYLYVFLSFKRRTSFKYT